MARAVDATTPTGWPATATAQRDRVARIDAVAKAALADRDERRRPAARARAGQRRVERGARQRGVHARYLTIYRTLADPAYLDPTIDPDDRELGTVFAFPDPLDANYGYGGLARVDDGPGLAVDVVGAVEPRRHGRHAARR